MTNYKKIVFITMQFYLLQASHAQEFNPDNFNSSEFDSLLENLNDDSDVLDFLHHTNNNQVNNQVDLPIDLDVFEGLSDDELHPFENILNNESIARNSSNENEIALHNAPIDNSSKNSTSKKRPRSGISSKDAKIILETARKKREEERINQINANQAFLQPSSSSNYVPLPQNSSSNQISMTTEDNVTQPQQTNELPASNQVRYILVNELPASNSETRQQKRMAYDKKLAGLPMTLDEIILADKYEKIQLAQTKYDKKRLLQKKMNMANLKIDNVFEYKPKALTRQERLERDRIAYKKSLVNELMTEDETRWAQQHKAKLQYSANKSKK